MRVGGAMSDNLNEGAKSTPALEGDADKENAGAVLIGLFLSLWNRVRSRIMALDRPRLVLGVAVGVGLAIVIVAAFSQSLTAALRAASPQRIAGIERTGVQADNSAIRIHLGQNTEHLDSSADGKKVALRELSGPGAPEIETVGGRGSSADYLPKLSDLPTAGTVITVPSGQGRLLRFDEAVESVFVADTGVADIRVVSSDLVYVYGKKLGLTNLIALSERPSGQDQDGNTPRRQQLTASALLRVVVDDRPSSDAMQGWAPSAPVDISVFGRRATVKGHVRDIDEAVDVANVAETYSPQDQPPLNNTTLDSPNQVNIRVRFAEASRSDLKSFGIDWNFQIQGGSFSFGLAKSGATSEANRNLEIDGSAGNLVNLELLIDALQANGALSILAEPNLTAVTGETASFLAGGEVPIPVPAGNGDSITVQYKPFGVSLAFTPTLVKNNRIALRVKPEVSSIADFVQLAAVQGFTLPSFTVRRAETTVEIASGQTFAIAGLFQRDISRNVDKMPVLGDIPILGQLFRSERYRRNETELVILITPYLVEPVSDKSLATPLDRAGPSSWQADVFDPTAKGALLAAPDEEYVDQSGFILK